MKSVARRGLNSVGAFQFRTVSFRPYCVCCTDVRMYPIMSYTVPCRSLLHRVCEQWVERYYLLLCAFWHCRSTLYHL